MDENVRRRWVTITTTPNHNDDENDDDDNVNDICNTNIRNV